MSSIPRLVTGTRDMFPLECAKFDRVVDVFRTVAVGMGFGEIRTPIIEQLPVFARSLGPQSDVVSKEMFLLRTSEPECLRPEATAGACTVCLIPSACPDPCCVRVPLFYLCICVYNAWLRWQISPCCCLPFVVAVSVCVCVFLSPPPPAASSLSCCKSSRSG